MNRITLLGLAALIAAGLLGLGLNADDTKGADHKHGGPYMECAKECDECGRTCDACTAHCAKLVADSKREHLHTLATCADCAATCKAASCITARSGPFSDLICTACADACKRCGEACEKFKDDEQMKQCAEECRRCEKACVDMVKHAHHGRD
jgi:hypothetical protein